MRILKCRLIGGNHTCGKTHVCGSVHSPYDLVSTHQLVSPHLDFCKVLVDSSKTVAVVDLNPLVLTIFIENRSDPAGGHGVDRYGARTALWETVPKRTIGLYFSDGLLFFSDWEHDGDL